MKRYILYTLVAFTLPICGGTDGRFRLEGEFEHLRQGEFYIYSNDGGAAALDTIKLEDGRFDYETELKGQATYYLLYPNLSEQVIFGASGDVVEVKGDARNLKSVEVKGSEPNEQLTAFRLENMDKGTAELRKAAADFIAQSPASPVSVFLFKTYFLQADDVPQGEVRKHYRALCKAQPDNLQLLGWQADVEALGKVLAKGSKLPAFRFKSRNGEEVELPPRPIVVESAVLLGLHAEDDEVAWDVAFTVSKGTYIRALARDIGRAAKSAAHVGALRRTASGSVGLSVCRQVEDLEGLGEAELALDPVAALGIPQVVLPDDVLADVLCGKRVPAWKIVGKGLVPEPFGADERCAIIIGGRLTALAWFNGAELVFKDVFPEGIGGVICRD